jgi:hypothetical protein
MPGVNIPAPLPWEKDATDVIHKGTQILEDINDAASCREGAVFAGAGSLYYTGKAQNAAAAVSGAASKLAFRFGVVGFVLGVANSYGFC